MKSKQKFVKKKEFLQEYEDTAKDYDFERLKDYEGITVLKTQLKILTKILKKNKAKNILEAGCGTGRILLPLTKKGFNIEGFDLSKNMIKELKKKNPMIKTKIGDIEKIPYKNNEFDFVYSVTVLMHLPKIEKAISEMYRITKKGGTIVFDLSNKESIWTKLAIMLDSNKKRTTFYSRKDLKRILKNYDYQLTGIFSYARTFYKIPLIKYLFGKLDKYLPLPVSFRSQYYIIIKKKN